MNRIEFLMMLQILIQQDKRLKVHTLDLDGQTYKHNEKKCEKCRATYFLEHPNDIWQ